MPSPSYIEAMRELQHRIKNDRLDGSVECYNRALRHAVPGPETVAVGQMAEALAMRGIDVRRPIDRW